MNAGEFFNSTNNFYQLSAKTAKPKLIGYNVSEEKGMQSVYNVESRILTIH
jgi:hypothetical protein